jgi:Glycosyl hydrolases family 28/Immunoglobulin domain/Cadherin-like domain/Immunoglobulin I-set domain
MWFASAPAAVLWYEPFSSSVYANNSQLNKTVGNGWGMGNSAGSGAAVVSNTAALTYSGLVTSNSSYGLILPTATTSNRHVGNTNLTVVALGVGTNVYASFLLNIQAAPAANRLLVSLESGAANTPAPGLGVWVNSSSQMFVSRNSSTASPLTSALASGTHLVVVRYRPVSGTASDTVSLWLDPAPANLGVADASVPSETVSTSSGGADLANIGTFLVNGAKAGSGGLDATNGTFWVDEIRVGTNWADVTPSSNANSGVPGVTTQPADQAVTTGQNATFTLVASGTAPLAYQWYYNTNTALAAATNASLTVTNVRRVNAGFYSALITNSSGSVTSRYAALSLVDTPPVAGNDTVVRPQGAGLKIRIADLLTNDTDADGDALALTGVTASTNGVNLTTNTTLIFYTNAPDVNDRFSYIISDGYGGSATGFVYVVTAANLPGQAQTTSVSGTNVTLTFAGRPGSVYVVQRSTNLTAWVALTTNTAPAVGLFQVQDGFADLGGTPAQAYYRLQFLALAATAPAITTQPQSQTVVSGQNATFTVTASGVPPPAYQWYFNNAVLAGQTGAALTAGSAGNYFAVAANSAGSATSSIVTLTVLVPPSVTTQPTNFTATVGQNATFSVAAAGTAPLGYQWYFNTNTLLANATNAALTLTNVQSANAGTYSVLVTNGAGSVTSSIVTLTVLVPPSVTTQPTNFTATVGQNATFSVVAAGTAPLGYQWYFNTNTLLANATNAALTVTNVQTTNAGTYSVLVTNVAGSVTSAVVTLTVNSSVVAPSITTQPTNFTATVGQNAAFSVVAAGTAPLGYQWYFNVNTLLAGATNATLSLTNVQPDDAGGYAVVVTNAAGAVTSSVVQLTLTAAAGMPTLPSIPAGVYLVTKYGAVGDGATVNTTAIQNAINAASAAGGGTVEIPAAAGAYLSGPLTLKSKINLQVDSGAELQMLPYASWSGTTTFINGSSISDVEISGSGTIDGQGSDWWTAYKSSGISRPNFINFSSCNRISILDVTLQNPPTFHLMLKNNNGNLTIQGITINTPGTSPNTDGMDLASTNILVRDCYISDGDDNIEIGGSDPLANLTVTNCNFGTGHGVSMGSITSGGVSNITVVNCTFTNTDYGIRMKSDNDRGGVVQNCNYYNLTMSSINKGAVVIYSYYNAVGTPTGITPATAAATNAVTVTSTTPIWRNIIISNVTASVDSSGIAGIIWARTELPATNITLSHLNITASKNFDLYNVQGLTIADSLITLPAGTVTYSLFNTQFTLTNSAPVAGLVTFDGVTTNGYGSTWALYNVQGGLALTNALDNGPLTLGGASTLNVSNSLTLFSSTVLNYALAANSVATRLAVAGNLALGGTVNISTNAGFTTGTYTLMTYTGSLSGTVPTLGTTPAGNTYSLSTGTAGQVNLIVSP